MAVHRSRWFSLTVLALLVTAEVSLAAEPVVFRLGNQAEPSTLDPHLASTAWENNIIGDLFMGLTTDDIEARPIAGMAESWTISPDGLLWTFKLRPNLVWSDGVPLKASDFVFGFRHLFDPKTAAPYSSIQYQIKNAEAVNSGKLPPDQVGVRAPDDRTVEIELATPTPFLLGLLTHYTAYPIPEHAYRKFGENWNKAGNMVSNGPFTLVSWKANAEIVAKKNPLFFDAKNVAIDEVIYYATDDTMAALNRFRARDIDANIGTRGFPVSQYPLLKQNMPGEAHVSPMLGTEYIALNIRKAPFSDARLRKAISLCLDRPVLTDKVLKDEQVPAFSFVPPGIDNYHGGPKLNFLGLSMDQRRAEAKRLLAEAGYTADRPLIFEYKYMISIDSRRTVVAQSAMLKECNMVVRLIGNEAKIHYDVMKVGDFTAAQARWGADYNDPQTFLYLLDSRSGSLNYGGYNNPAFDAIFDQSKVTLDLEKRAELLTQAEQLMLDDAALVPLSFFTSKSLVAPYVKGYADNVTNIHRTRWMRIER